MPKELILNGRVQGVCCRHYCSQIAKKLGIKGAASNLQDGTVQVLIDSDDEEKIRKFISALRENPFSYNFYGTITGSKISDYTGHISGDYVF